jgi:hypothetical protein
VGIILGVLVGTGGVMTFSPAERVAALLKTRYPGGEVSVTQEPDGLAIEVYTGDASSLFASIADEHSAMLIALELPQEAQ